MKLNIDIDCTPQEAREFLGFPNVAPLQDKMMKELEAKMRESMDNLDPETFIKTWLPVTMKGWGDLQTMMMRQMGMSGTKPDPDNS